MSNGPLGSTRTATAPAVGGVFSIAAPAPVDGQSCALQVDSAGNLLVNVAVGGGGGGSNASVGVTGATAPTSATEIGSIDVNGKLQGVSATNPLPISGSISATNPSVGTTGASAPTSATEIGVIDGTGKLQGASVSNPVRVDPTGTTTQPVSGTVNVGNSPTVSLAAATAVELLDSAGTNKASISAAGAVKVDGSAATQPISGTVTANAGTNLNTSALALDATLTGGTQKTKIVDTGGANVASVSAAGAVKVDGSAATQPISGTVTATQATGTNLHVVVDSAPTTAVTLPAGQAVELLDSGGTNKASISAAGAVKVDGSAATQPVSGTFFQATQPVSIAATLAVNNTQQGTASQNVAQFGGTNVSTGTGASGAGIPRVTISNDSSLAANQSVNVNQVGGTAAAATAKGTQAANGIGTQDLKDSGRVIKVFSASFTAATTEALVTLTPITDGTAGSTGTSFSITAGKRFRIQALLIATKNAGAAIQGVICNLRMSASGAVTAASPLIATVGAGTLSATANNVNAESASIPDGLELSGTMQFGVSQLGTATAGNIITLIGYEY